MALSPLLSIFFDSILKLEWDFLLNSLTYFGVFLYFFFKEGQSPIRFPKYLIFYLLFSLYLYFSAFILYDKNFEFKYIYQNKMLAAVNLIFIIENITISKSFYNKLFNISKVVLVLAFLVILYQELVDGSFLMRQDLSVDSTFLGPKSEYRLKSIYSYLGYLTFGLGFLPILLWVIEIGNIRMKKILFWVFIGFLYAFLSKARWLMVNSITILLVLLIREKNKFFHSFKYFIYFISIIFLGYQALNFLGVDTNSIIENRILEKQRSNDAKSYDTRIFAFKVFNKLFWEKPFLGAGDHKYGMGGTGRHEYKLRALLQDRSAQIHVGYLSLFYKFGLIGGSFFLGFLFYLLRDLYWLGRNYKIWSPLFGIAGFALVNFTQVSFIFLELGLIFMIFVFRFYTQEEKETG